MSPGSAQAQHGSSIVVLGADTVLAALPATPVQLAHACRALGYDMAFPASWGDEIVASACLEQLAAFGSRPAILCACPHVTQRLTRSGTELAPYMITLAAPPVAAARYLRALYGERPVQITYAGSCPSATDPAIDVRISPEELFAAFSEHGIDPLEQPELFDSVLPPDRRRFYSEPGGAPNAERLAELDTGRTLVELRDAGPEFALDLAQRLLARQRDVIDLAPRLGCACSGVLVEGAAHGTREALTALEPPRSNGPVLDPAIRVDVALSLSDIVNYQAAEAVVGGADGAEIVEVARPAVESGLEAGPNETADGLAYGVADVQPQLDRDPVAAAADGPGATTPLVRHRPGATPRRSAGRAPSLVRQDGAVIPRAYAARALRRGGANMVTGTSDASRGMERELPGRGHPAGTGDGPRRSLRLPRSVVIPLTCEPPRSVPPPPAKQHSGSALNVGMVLGEA